MNEKLLRHIDYIASVAGENGHKLTTVRFVKFLYLLDVLYMKHTGSRMTNWTWKFWDFGPYCLESLKILEEATKKKIIKSTSFQSTFDESRDYELFSCALEGHMDREKHINKLEHDEGIPTMVKLGMRSYIEKYGSDTYGLLDYVYFGTAPMKKANPREILDFSVISKEEDDDQLGPAKLSRKKIKKAKEAIKKMKKNMLEEQNYKLLLIKPEYLDADYIKGMAILNQQDEWEENVDDFLQEKQGTSARS